MMRETWKGTEAPVLAPAAVVLRAGCRSGDWTRRDWKPASSQPVGQAVVRQQAVTRLDPGNLIGRDILKLFNGRGRNFSFRYQGNGVDIRRLSFMLLTSDTFDTIRFDNLSSLSIRYDSFIVWSYDDTFFFAGSWKVKREDIGKLRKNFLRRCFLNGLADFCNWNLPWRKHASVRVDICAMHEKPMNCKITLCVCVYVYVYILYIIYFNRNVAIKLVDSKTNGFLFLR